MLTAPGTTPRTRLCWQRARQRGNGTVLTEIVTAQYAFQRALADSSCASASTCTGPTARVVHLTTKRALPTGTFLGGVGGLDAEDESCDLHGSGCAELGRPCCRALCSVAVGGHVGGRCCGDRRCRQEVFAQAAGAGITPFPASRGCLILAVVARPATAQQRKVILFGQTLLRVNPALQPDALRDALIAELPTYLPGVQPDLY